MAQMKFSVPQRYGAAHLMNFVATHTECLVQYAEIWCEMQKVGAIRRIVFLDNLSAWLIYVGPISVYYFTLEQISGPKII